MAGPTGCGRHVGGALGRVGIVAGLRGRYRGLGNGLGFGWLGSIGLFLCNGSNGSNESISAASAGVSLTFINPASSVVLGYGLELGSSGKLDFGSFYQPFHGKLTLNSTSMLRGS
jgi:hypothetical protein